MVVSAYPTGNLTMRVNAPEPDPFTVGWMGWILQQAWLQVKDG